MRNEQHGLGSSESWLRNVAEVGFAIMTDVFGPEHVATIRSELAAALQASPEREAAILGHPGSIYGARNLLALWPGAAHVWRQPPLPDLLAAVLGPEYGLVRVLYFDKPPERSWALPWHKDLTIAVRDNQRPSPRFAKPTRKAGVPHVEAPEEVLQAMLTVRIHLDDMNDENGSLQVLPGSHRSGTVLRLDEGLPRSIHVRQGDVLLMRPLLAHSSINARPGSQRHRRLVHLEFAASPQLPDGYAWHTFLPGLI